MYFKTTRPMLLPDGYRGADADPPLLQQPVLYVMLGSVILIVVIILMMRKS